MIKILIFIAFPNLNLNRKTNLNVFNNLFSVIKNKKKKSFIQ